MSEELLVIHCSPTLAGLKTGSLFTAECRKQAEFIEKLCAFNRLLVPKGLRILPMKKIKNRVLVYVYRPSKLEEDFANEHVYALLKSMGYPCKKPQQCVACLAKKLRENEAFPHEIGLFLGYPPEDVRGFIENKAGHCKCMGCWKVYGDVEQAQEKFRQFRKCADIYLTQWQKGFSIERLTVAV